MPGRRSAKPMKALEDSSVATIETQIEPKYFRRCHVCQAVSESEQEVEHCGSCLKPLARFYFFDVKKTAIYTDNKVRELSIWDEYHPILGLTALW